MLNGVFAKLLNIEFASGEVAIPTSPIPPARASGVTRKNGTAEVTTLIGFVVWALATLIAPPTNITRAVSFKVTFFMRFVLSWLGRLTSISVKFKGSITTVKIVVLFIQTNKLLKFLEKDHVSEEGMVLADIYNIDVEVHKSSKNKGSKIGF